MEIYDKNGKLIGYVRRDDILAKPPLEDTRQKDERKREVYLAELAEESCKNNWNRDQIQEAINRAFQRTNLKSAKSIENAKHEAMLAAQPGNREKFKQLMSIRDQCWNQEHSFVKAVRHGPSQVLIDLLRRNSRSGERQHASSSDAYLRYLHKIFPNK